MILTSWLGFISSICIYISEIIFYIHYVIIDIQTILNCSERSTALVSIPFNWIDRFLRDG